MDWHSVHFAPFGPFRSILVHLSKSEKKKKLWVESTSSYLSNINCNYMISFNYHDNLFKKIRNLINKFES